MRKQLMTEMLACMLTMRLRRRKNFFRLASIIALVSVIFFGMMSCDDGSSNGGGSGEELPKASGKNAVSGKTYFEYDKIVFSTTADSASSGSYTIKSEGWDDDADEYISYDTETGTYTWNEGAKTVTLKPEKIPNYFADYGNPALIGQAEVRQYLQAQINQYKQQMGQEAFKQYLSSMGFSSESALITYAINLYFGNKTYSYSFSNDGRALFLEQALPANKGTDQFAGKIYYGRDHEYGDEGEHIYIKNENEKYVFASSGNNTYTEIYTSSWDGTVTTRAGSYAYDSNMKMVWLRPEKINGKTRAEIYDDYSDDYDNDYRAAETNNQFRFYEKQYDATNKTIGDAYGD